MTNGNEINFILHVLNENELLYLKVNVFFKKELVASNTIYGYSTKLGTFNINFHTIKFFMNNYIFLWARFPPLSCTFEGEMC